MKIIEIIIGFIFCFLILIKIIPFLKKYFLDKPNARSSHYIPKPKSGGLVFALIAIFYNLISGDFNALKVLPITIVGFIDDKSGLSSSFRLISQFLTCTFLLFNSEIYLANQYFLISSFLFFIFIVLSGMSLINFCNFMDGIDGLLAGCMVIIFSGISIISDANYSILVGALIAFLIFNWSPSKLFMGDVGSYFLGATFVSAIYNANSINTSIAITLFSFPLIIDAFICVIMRFKTGQNILSAHDLHLYQRLSRGKLDHQNVSLIYIFSTLSIVTSYIMGGLKYEIIIAILLLFLGFLLEKYYAVSFNNKFN